MKTRFPDTTSVTSLIITQPETIVVPECTECQKECTQWIGRQITKCIPLPYDLERKVKIDAFLFACFLATVFVALSQPPAQSLQAEPQRFVWHIFNYTSMTLSILAIPLNQVAYFWQPTAQKNSAGVTVSEV